MLKRPLLLIVALLMPVALAGCVSLASPYDTHPSLQGYLNGRAIIGWSVQEHGEPDVVQDVSGRATRTFAWGDRPEPRWEVSQVTHYYLDSSEKVVIDIEGQVQRMAMTQEEVAQMQQAVDLPTPE